MVRRNWPGTPGMNERALRRKLTFRAHGSSIVLVKRPIESTEHVLQKALLWAMYLPLYPTLRVEVHLPGPSRYKPDLLALDGERPVFWGECGVVSTEKLADLLRRYRNTHFVFSKWSAAGNATHPFAVFVERALKGVRRLAPVELVVFPAPLDRYFDELGNITVDPDDVPRQRWE